MFDRNYIIKIYSDGQHAPMFTFKVKATLIVVDGHKLKIDGILMEFADNQYITYDLI